MRILGIILPLLFLLSASPAKDFSFRLFSNNEEVQLSDYYGQPLVVNFWAAWCPPCKAEMPTFDKVWKETKDFQLIGIAIDSTQDPKSYVKNKKYEWVFGLDKNGADVYNIDAVPTTLFIDKDGNLVVIQVGAMEEADFRKAIKKIT